MKASFSYKDTTLFLDFPEDLKGQCHITDDDFRSIWVESSAVAQNISDALSEEDSAHRRIARENLTCLIRGFEPGMNRVLK